MNIYSIKNEKLGFFNRPIYCESDAEALSMIQNILMSDADRALSGLKSDLSLYFLGSIDFTTGVIIPTMPSLTDGFGKSAPIFICTLEDIFNSIPEERLKPELTRDDLLKAYEKIESLEDIVVSLSDKLNSHRHHRKEIIK